MSVQYVSPGYYADHDGYEYICVQCPRRYTTDGPGATSMDDCAGEKVLHSLSTECSQDQLYMAPTLPG